MDAALCADNITIVHMVQYKNVFSMILLRCLPVSLYSLQNSPQCLLAYVFCVRQSGRIQQLELSQKCGLDAWSMGGNAAQLGLVISLDTISSDGHKPA